MKSFRRFFSFEWFLRAIDDVRGRFPFTLCWLSALTLWQMCLVWIWDSGYRVLYDSVAWVLSEGLLLSLVVSLWCEFMERSRHVKSVQLAVFCLVFADFAFLMLRGGVSEAAESVGRGAVTTALIAGIFFLPCVRGLDRKALWQYTMSQTSAFAVALALSGVLMFACIIIAITLEFLFHFFNDSLFQDFMWFFGLWVPAVMYLSRIPRAVDLSPSGRLYNFSFVGTFSRTILLPLVSIYMIILYVYGFKILVTWELPVASLSWMVTGLMCVCLVMLYGVDGVDAEETKIVGLIRRILPAAIIPLLVLMSVGLVYRIGEYGITVSRLYVAVYNIWAYGVALYLLCRKNANLNVVAVSFALVFVAVSIVPGLNLTTVSNRVVRSEIIRELDAAGVTEYPIDEARLKDIIASMPEKEARNLASKIEYLDDWSDHSRVADIVTSDSKLDEWRLIHDVRGEDGLAFQLECPDVVEIPQGFTHVMKYYTNFNQRLVVDSVGKSSLAVDGYTVLLPVDSLLEVNESDTSLSLPAVGDDGSEALVVFTHIRMVNSDDTPRILNTGCYIFTK